MPHQHWPLRTGHGDRHCADHAQQPDGGGNGELGRWRHHPGERDQPRGPAGQSAAHPSMSQLTPESIRASQAELPPIGTETTGLLIEGPSLPPSSPPAPAPQASQPWGRCQTTAPAGPLPSPAGSRRRPGRWPVTRWIYTPNSGSDKQWWGFAILSPSGKLFCQVRNGLMCIARTYGEAKRRTD